MGIWSGAPDYASYFLGVGVPRNPLRKLMDNWEAAPAPPEYDGALMSEALAQTGQDYYDGAVDLGFTGLKLSKIEILNGNVGNDLITLEHVQAAVLIDAIFVAYSVPGAGFFQIQTTNGF